MIARTIMTMGAAVAPLLLVGPAAADLTALRVLTVPNPYGIVTRDVYVEFDNPEDMVLAVGGTHNDPMLIEVVGGTFYQHALGSDQPPNPILFASFPELRYDSFITIGVLCFNPAQPGFPEGSLADNCLLTPNWPGFGASTLGTTEMAWFITADDAQGLPDQDGRVLIGRFSTTDGSSVEGRIVVLMRIKGDVGEPDRFEYGLLHFCHDDTPGCVEGDVDADNIVDINDFLDVLACWGPVIPGCEPMDFLPDPGEVGIQEFLSVLAHWTAQRALIPQLTDDLTGDGIINVFDLMALLGVWGPCPAPCPADFDGDGEVGVNDLMILLGNWGPLP